MLGLHLVFNGESSLGLAISLSGNGMLSSVTTSFSFRLGARLVFLADPSLMARHLLFSRVGVRLFEPNGISSNTSRGMLIIPLGDWKLIICGVGSDLVPIPLSGNGIGLSYGVARFGFPLVLLFGASSMAKGFAVLTFAPAWPGGGSTRGSLCMVSTGAGAYETRGHICTVGK